MAVLTERHKIKSYPFGLGEKSIVGSVFQPGIIKREARKTVIDAIEIQNDFPKLKELIQKHDLGEVKKIAEKIIRITHEGLQLAYFYLFKEYLALNEKLKEDADFAAKHGSQLNDYQKKLYREYLGENLKTISETLSFINELKAEIKEKGKEQGKLNEIASDYHSNKTWTRFAGFLNFLNKQVEALFFGNEAKSEFRLEKKIVSLEGGKINEGKIEGLLKKDKVYAARLKRIIERTFVYMLFIIRNAYAAGDEILTASSDKRWDLPESYEDFEIELTNLLNDELHALESLNTCRLQLEHEIDQALRALH